MRKQLGLPPVIDPDTVTKGYVDDLAVAEFADTIGDGQATSVLVLHNLETADVVISVYDSSTMEEVNCDKFRVDSNSVMLGFQDPPAEDSLRVIIIGGHKKKRARALLTGSGALSATTLVGPASTYVVSAVLTGTGTVSVVVYGQYRSALSLAGSGVLSTTIGITQDTQDINLAGSGALSATVSGFYTPHPLLSGSGVLAATVGVTSDSLVTALTGSGVLSGTAHQRHVRAGALAGDGTLSASALEKYYGNDADFEGSGDLSVAVGVLSDAVLAALSGSGILGVTVSEQFLGRANLSGVGSLAVTTRSTYTFTSSFAGSSLLSVTTGVSSDQRAATLTGAGVLSTTARGQYNQTATLAGGGTLSATVVKTKDTVVATFAGAGILSAVADLGVFFSRTLDPSGIGVLTATAIKTKDSVAASLSGAGVLVAPADKVGGSFNRSAFLNGDGALSVTAVKTADAVTADFSGAGTLLATADPNVGESFSRGASFTGTGVLAVALGTNLDATLAGSGALSATVGVRSDQRVATLTGSGALSVMTGYGLAAVLTGSGALSVTVGVLKDQRPAVLTGSGALAAAANPGVGADLTGSGVLSVTRGVTKDARAAVLTGSGALSGIGVVKSDSRPATLTGSGTLTTAISVATQHFIDQFNDVNGPLSANWASLTSPDAVIFNSQFTNNTAGGYQGAQCTVAMATANHMASIVVGAVVAGDTGFILGVRHDTATGDHVFVTCQDGVTWTISTTISSATVSRATSGVLSFKTGDVLSLIPVGNVYTLYKNEVSVLSWSDGGNVFVPGAGNRYTFLETATASVWGRGANIFAADEGTDVRIVPRTAALAGSGTLTAAVTILAFPYTFPFILA